MTKPAKPHYRAIYDDVIANEPRYNQAENSPGFQVVVRNSESLKMIQGRTLDVGCGVGFVVGHLTNPMYQFHPFGVDISEEAITRARRRLSFIPHIESRLQVISDQTLPFEEDYFSLVTCFDVLEHLDPDEIDSTLSEISRVVRPGGLFIGSASCRKAGMIDKFGENLHRTVRSPDWWIERAQPNRAEYDGSEMQITMWKRKDLDGNPLFPASTEVVTLFPPVSDRAQQEPKTKPIAVVQSQTAAATSEQPPIDVADPHNSTQLYQEIYEQNEWYGNAHEGRCPGVRLIPEYEEWIQSPVLDLGCGRGHTVEKLRELGFEADGIDQIRIHPDMQVGDISKPLNDMERYQSVTCIDCIEHLYEEQVIGLFDNMKRVERHAFSIHNGPSNDTGQELHVNRMDFTDWHRLISQHFDIAAAIKIHDEQMLYLTKRKTGAV
jgi:SAM-dependent methyltransferase